VRLPGKAGLHDEIVQTSIDLGAELGEEGLTMRAIAARLGVSSTVLYQHFESKSAILTEIRLHGVRMLSQDLSEANGSTRVEHLASMAERYVTFALAHPWLYRVLFTGESIDWDTVVIEDRQELLGPLAIVRDFLEQGRRAGAFAADLDVDHTALMLWASMHGLAAMLLDGRISDSHPIFPVRDIPGFVRTYVEGIARGLELPSKS
jgi:AcrR family transcriptional regulator